MEVPRYWPAIDKMKNCVFLVCFLALAVQIHAQCLPGFAPVISSPEVVPAPAIIQAGSVANTLADTLSLLTVSSLLADKLPLGCGCGCGCGCGWGSGCGCGWGSGCGCGCGYPYIYY